MDVTLSGRCEPNVDTTGGLVEILHEGTVCPDVFQIRLDIRPICDQHDSEADIRELDGDCAHSFYVYVCREPDCNRVYCRLRGYCRLPGEEQLQVRRCPHDDQALFRKEIEPDGRSIWECPRKDCGWQIRIGSF